MFFVSIIFLTIFISSIQSLKPTLNLTFTPDEKYYTSGHSVDITCEFNQIEYTETPQLWYVDFKTGKYTPISRSLIHSPANDSPDVFKYNKNRRLEYVKKNHLRIKSLRLEDSAQYSCNCPDCTQDLDKKTKDLQVMKLMEPKWHIEPDWPMVENSETTIKCTVNDFYPYVGYKIIHRHHEISHQGKSVIPNNNTYPQKFSWEATVTPTADWHNTTLRCIVIQGNREQYATKNLEVLFTPRFLKCDQTQYVDSTQQKATIQCIYSGNPQPKLTWFRQTDEKPLTLDLGITIETKDEHLGKYKSIVTFDREKLVAIPLTTTTESSHGQTATRLQSKVIIDNYYQYLLNSGFIVKLTYKNEDKGSKKINIVIYPQLTRSNLLDNSTIKTIQSLSTSIILFSFIIILYMI